MQSRRQWILVSLPGELKRIVDGLTQLSNERQDFLRHADISWNDRIGEWFRRTSNRIPVDEFHLELARWAESCGELAGQSSTQKKLLNELQVRASMMLRLHQLSF